METVGDLIAELNNFSPGSEVELELVRGGEETTARVTLGEWPSYLSEPRRRVIPFPGEGSPFHDFPERRRR